MRAEELRERRRFDYRVVSGMRGPAFDFQAYRSTADLERGRNEITDEAQAGDASKYRMTLRIPTLIGPGRFCQETVIGVDLDVRDYPMSEPGSWIISDPIPWSPHFRKGSPICIGNEFWAARQGHVTLGDLVIHISMMLNWDEKGRGSGYQGWNGEAITYHRKHYNGRPLDPDLVYPALPQWIFGVEEESSGFEIIEHVRPTW